MPGSILGTEVAAVNEIGLRPQEAGIPVEDMTININSRDVGGEKSQLIWCVEHSVRVWSQMTAPSLSSQGT